MKLTPTDEQLAILDASRTGEATTILAGAGTGKSSTLRLIAQDRPTVSMLYLAFNRAVVDDARGTFPSNTHPSTAHGLAYRAFGGAMAPRFKVSMPPRAKAEALGIAKTFGLDADTTFSPTMQASLALSMVNRFCRTPDPDLSTSHLPPPPALHEKGAEALAEHLLPLARRAWADLTAGGEGKLRTSHDHYLKQWQLSAPKLTDWETILFDEGQDADPVIADVIANQDHAQVIAVGDSSQAIYGWRGAGDFLSTMPAEHRLSLTQSWRFGPAIADEANRWLGVIGAELRLVGSPHIASHIGPLTTPDATLCRSNAGAIESLLAGTDAGRRVHLEADCQGLLWFAREAAKLQRGGDVTHPDLAGFSSWGAAVHAAETDPSSRDIAATVALIERYSPAGVIRAVEASVPADTADSTVITAHKAKGGEWAKVQIGSDFYPPSRDPTTGRRLPIPREEAMLAFVAVTRAQSSLDISGLDWAEGQLAEAA